MKEIIEEISRRGPASRSTSISSRASAPGFSIANYRTMVARARQRAAVLGEQPAVPRISDLGHLYASSLGKLELDMMGSHQMTERQVLDAVHGRGDRDRVRGIRRQARPGRDRRDLLARA